jgi:alkylation response protein AidB-like acyl-CoA dehydrogenase
MTPEETEYVRVVRQFVDESVRPVASKLEHENEYPELLIEQMKSLGIFGLMIPEPYGGSRVSMRCFSMVTEELARGWMSLAGSMGSHSVISHVITRFGTDEQKEEFLPRLATGEIRAAMALTEPDGGSDLQNMRTTARLDGDHYVVNGSKTWITNSRRAGVIAILCKTDAAATPRHHGMSLLLVEAGAPGLSISRDLPKLGYKGVESCELSFADLRVPVENVVGGVPGRGFTQMMNGLEVGRIQVASRSLGVGRAALEDSLRYSQQRQAFDVAIWQHQSVANYLADSATKLEAARQLVLHAADVFDSGRRADMEASMAKVFASEVGMEVALNAMRIHGGNGYSPEYDVERYFRDAPLMIVGEGTNEIQRNVIARQLIQQHKI